MPDTDTLAASTARLRYSKLDDRLASATMRNIPVNGDQAPSIETQGRQAGHDTSPDGLAELITSISQIGQIQPIVVEQFEDGHCRVLVGERRLRALQIGSVEQPENPHFPGTARALVIPGPLTELDRRVIQLAENVARSDLTATDQAHALLLNRCGLLMSKLEAAGVDVDADELPETVVARWEYLDQLRTDTGNHHLGAPWAEVLATVGLHLSESRAQQLVRSLKDLPPELVEHLDALEVSVESRKHYAALIKNGREDAVNEILDAVAESGNASLYAAAAKAALDDPDLTGEEAVAAAQAAQDKANEARSNALLAGNGDVGGGDFSDDPDGVTWNSPNTDSGGMPADAVPDFGDPGPLPDYSDRSEGEWTIGAGDMDGDFADVTGYLGESRRLVETLRAGIPVRDPDKGSIRMLAAEILALLDGRSTDVKVGAKAAGYCEVCDAPINPLSGECNCSD